MAMVESEREAREEQRQNAAAKDEAFAQWLASPLVRLGLSMIPKAENDEAVRMVLRSAFDTGAEIGAGLTAVRLARMLMGGDKPKRGQ